MQEEFKPTSKIAQTVLESLEQAYINTLNILEESKRDDNIGNYICEEAVCSLSEITKSIMLLITEESVYPTDKRVYIDITENNNIFTCSEEELKYKFVNTLYEHDILTKELTIGELIEELKRFSPRLKVNILGEKNSLNKIVVDDTYLDKIILVGVEH